MPLVVALVTMIALPGTLYAKMAGSKLTRQPVVVETKNSQTIELLEAFLNIDPTGTGGAEIAIVDGTALDHDASDGDFFIDAEKSGSQISVYIVRKGDSLASIAKMFDVSVNTIIWANDIKNGKISEGQELVILPISGVRHTVKSGDTLKFIAAKYKADVEDILTYNDITPSAKLIVGEIIVVPNGTVPSQGSLAPKIGSIKTQVAGYFVRPLSGGKKSQGIHGNNGIDIAAPTGTPIVASADGKVIIARGSGYNGGYGLYVVISHPNGTQTLYAHLSRLNVSVGQNVKQGQVIGWVGNTGRSTGSHLHLEVRGARNPF
jgi:murein DD-endopeptidase MepM/ murein hydrolase activator NlpD